MVCIHERRGWKESGVLAYGERGRGPLQAPRHAQACSVVTLRDGVGGPGVGGGHHAGPRLYRRSPLHHRADPLAAPPCQHAACFQPCLPQASAHQIVLQIPVDVVPYKHALEGLSWRNNTAASFRCIQLHTVQPSPQKDCHLTKHRCTLVQWFSLIRQLPC